MSKYGPEWEAVRLVVLERDGYRCTLNLECCTGVATTADHIIERDQGGTNHPSNLRAACLPCNARRGAQYGNAKRAARRHAPHPFFGSDRQDPAAVSVLSLTPDDAGLSSQPKEPTWPAS
jgi:5-methylcytosine-specific restriction endonuclease McrA